jgi:malate dehydrogenase
LCSVGDIVATLASRDERVWRCSTHLEEEYGLSEVSIGAPVRLGPGRVEEIVEFALERAERLGLEASAASIKETIKGGKALPKKGR